MNVEAPLSTFCMSNATYNFVTDYRAVLFNTDAPGTWFESRRRMIGVCHRFLQAFHANARILPSKWPEGPPVHSNPHILFAAKLFL